MPPDNSEYSLDCECGQTIYVAKTQAGAQLSCTCGRMLRVPRLSQLRRSKGQDALETGIRDQIARMIRTSELPRGPCCAVSGFPTDGVMLFDIVLERSYQKGSRNWGIALLIVGFLLPCSWIFWIIGFDLLNERTERMGRDTVLTVPLRVAGEQQKRLRGWVTQRWLRQVLSSVPEYDRLLKEYPGASIIPHR